MTLRQPWFLVMAPKAAAKRNDFWVAYDSALPLLRGDVVTHLIRPENRTLLAAFGIAWFAAVLLIWIWGFGSGAFSPTFSVLATVLAAGVTVASYVRLICVLMTAPTPKKGQSR